ncbi:energy transducer TonB [Paracnuella aquatica]|uniref:energy transducer TonB n=1 Tax=Paracnuella aquatica TaxID=2268757 RepID=UPI000DEFFE26|nr:hypothetical protein [Paracnuella aquatica]RPD46547.1 hypothetical protein DRJ53_14005 [Paracnuella aquatica]
MRTTSIVIFLTFLSTESFAQNSKSLLRNWIKTSVENLSDKAIAPDTLYTRYSFAKSHLNISFYPGWNDYTQPWSKSGNDLTLGFDTYKIEVLNDTALTIALDGFRRFKFLSEEYLSNKAEHLDSIGQYDNRPLFRANSFITPRYKGNGSFKDYVQKDLEGYNIKKASYFLATFIVTEEGKVENIIVHNGISAGFDAAVSKQLSKSTNNWTPAKFNGKPIQTKMIYEIKYLNSLTPTSSGILQ